MRHRRIVPTTIGAEIGCQTVSVANSPAIAGKDVDRTNHSKRNSGSCLVACHPHSHRAGGFTLIEQLVVIAIISLLLGLLIPGLHTPKDKVYELICRSNLKEMGLAILMYADQNGGLLPEITNLKQVALQMQEALQPYVKSQEIFCCSKDPNKPTLPGGSYDWRVTGNPETSISGVRLALLRYPSRVIIAGERCTGWHKSGMINVLFADGHVDQVTEEYWWDNITTTLQFK